MSALRLALDLAPSVRRAALLRSHCPHPLFVLIMLGLPADAVRSIWTGQR